MPLSMSYDRHVLSLPRGILGEFRLVWQAIGVMSIAADAAYLITGAAYFALGSLPLSIALGVVFYLFIMNTGYQFSRFVSSAGSYYKFVSVSLGGYMGVFQAWNMAFYIIIGYASFGFLGLASFLLLVNLSYSIIEYWPLVVITAGTISLLFTYFGIKVSTDYQILGGLLEIGTLLVGAIALIMMSGRSNTMLVFTTYFIKNNVYRLFQSMVYSVVLFFGTALAVTSLAEEAKQPEKTITRALLYTVFIAGATLVLVSYALTVSWGPIRMLSFASSPDPGLILFRRVNYALYILLLVLTVNSFMGFNVAFSNTASRVFYAFARDGIMFLPKQLMYVHRKYGSPYISALFIYAISVAIALVLGLLFGPVIGGLFGLYMNSYAAFMEHILASIGLPFIAKRRGRFKIIQHVVLPTMAIGTLVMIMILSLFPTPPPYPFNIAAYIGIAWIPTSALITFLEGRIHPNAINKAETLEEI